MKDLKELRKERGFSLTELASRCGISRQRLSDYESGRRRWSAAVARLVARQLGVETIWTPQRHMNLNQHRKLGGWSRWRPVAEVGGSWAEQRSGYEDLFRRLPADKFPDIEFRSAVRCDSMLEALAWTQLACAGAEPRFASPVLMNFDHYPLCNHAGRCLGVASCAALYFEDPRLKYILWPQMTLLIQSRRRRVDGLIRVHRKRRGFWVLLEIDGGAHTNSDWDLKKDAEVELPVLRFPSPQILGLQFPTLLYERLLNPTF